MGIVAKCEHL